MILELNTESEFYHFRIYYQTSGQNVPKAAVWVKYLEHNSVQPTKQRELCRLRWLLFIKTIH